MRRDSYDGWDDSQGGRRGRRGARADEQWPPDSQTRDSYPGRGSHRRSEPPPEGGAGGAGYADRGYSDPGYGDPRYSGGSDFGPGYGRSGYPDGDYAGSDYPSTGYDDHGYADQGYPGQAPGYGQSGGYARPGGYPDDGYPGAGYGSSGEHRAPAYGGTGPQDSYRDESYPPGGYRDGSYGAPDSYRAGPDGYGAGYGEQDRYGRPGGYDSGDPYGGPDARDQYLERVADYGPGADRGGRYGWRDQVDDTGLNRRRQRDPEDDFDPDSARHNGFFRGFGAQDDAVGHRPPRRKRSRAGIAALLILIIFIGAIVGGGAYAYRWYSKRHADWTNSKGYGSVVVQVMPGEFACSAGLENTLVSDGVVASASSFCNAAKSSGNGNALEPGYFRLRKHMGAALAWALITNPKSRVQIKVAIPDGMRASKVIALLAAKTGKPLSQFESALKDVSALGLPSWAKGNPEGFLWPATYEIQPGTSPLAILQMLVKQSTTEYASINLPAKAKAAQFTEYQVIIEASLLEAEVGPQYYTRVAKVIDNRLNMVPPMDLGLDSTVAYALNKYIYNLSQSDLNVNSPYNTTKHPGLPPGPIDSPDLAAIQAVLHPASSSTALYFVTVNKQGLTEFTSDPNQFAIWSAEAKRNGV